MTRRVAVAFAFLLLAACTRRETRFITPWLKVDVIRPRTGTSGVVVSGSSEEVFYARIGGRWRRLGVGHASGYIVLAGGHAVLFDLHDRNGLQLVREGAAPQPVPSAFGRNGFVVVPDVESDAIDIFDCPPDASSTCRGAQIDRHDTAGTVLASFAVSLPPNLTDCQLSGIAGYDRESVPYIVAPCKWKSPQAQCVLLAQRSGGPFLWTVGPDRPGSECSEFSRAGVSLRKPALFEGFQ